jgi:hypothetical protein
MTTGEYVEAMNALRETTTPTAAARGRGRPPIGERIELRLPPDVAAALDAEAASLGYKRAELARWIIAERYGKP